MAPQRVVLPAQRVVMAKQRQPHGTPMTRDMRDEWRAALRQWASNNDCVRELWLFGSWATGDATPESDVDVALVLTPPRGRTIGL
jgi:predicted nucleotidyltransferase